MLIRCATYWNIFILDLVFVVLALVLLEDHVEVHPHSLQVRVRALVLDGLAFDQTDVLDLLQVLHLVRHQDPALVLQVAVDTPTKYFDGHVRVHCAQRVVQQVDVCVCVHGARKTDACFLAAADRDAALADLGVSAFGHRLEVVVESAGLDDFVKFVFVEVGADEDVVFDGP